MRKVLFVATVVKTHINVFHLPYLKMLKDMGYETHVAARNDFENPNDCIIPHCDIFHDLPFERNPLKKKNYITYKKLKNIIKENDFDIVHCHTPVGGALARLVYKNLKNDFHGRLIYTAHGFHFFKGAPIKNWLVYYPIEKYLSRYTDVLITINKEDYSIAKNKFRMKQLEYVPGVGIDIEKFELSGFDCENYRKQLGVRSDEIMILSVGELISRKNHKVVVEAISKISNLKIKYFIAGRGELKEELENYIKELNLSKQIYLLGFRKDIPQLNKACNIFVFPSKQEGLPVALMEAQASGKICIASDIRGNNDLISNYKNGILFDPSDSNQLAQEIMYVINHEKEMNDYVLSGLDTIEKYSLKNIKNIMKKIYTINT